MISPDIEAPEEAVVNTPELPPPIPLRRSRNMAESIAMNTKVNNGLPLSQVLNFWGQQKGILFVKDILNTSMYEDMLPKEREVLLLEAARAIAHNWIEKEGYTGKTQSIDDRIFYHKSLFE